MISNKKGIQELAAILLNKGITDIVISPGSRNAPLINTFAGIAAFNCYSIVDERSAAFFALGIAIKTGKTVVLSCTSGTASLNYAPAIAEAYYQKVPLLILTADRPVEWTDQGDGQTIRQQNIYNNYIKKSFGLPQNINTDDDLWFTNRIVNQAVNSCRFPVAGPVHINIPFSEPLYETESAELSDVRLIDYFVPNQIPDKHQFDLFASMINTSKKVMLLVGQGAKDELLNRALEKISVLPQVIILSETNSNYPNTNGIACIDKVLATIHKEDEEKFAPDVLITFGEAIVSKKIKDFLRRNPPSNHVHVNQNPEHPDTYQHLTHSVFIKAESFFGHILPSLNSQKSSFRTIWINRSKKVSVLHKTFIDDCPYSDLKVFDKIFKILPHNCDLHMGNSSPVRYAQLFRHHSTTEHFSNRGTSGIDGGLSTAVGAAWSGQKPTVFITGDLSFFYDSNGLWNSYLSDKLRIIVINNGGGNIFRIIPGPSETNHIEVFFETRQNEKIKGFAATFGLMYFGARDMDELNKNLIAFFSDDLKTPAVLEIFTNNKISPEILKEYFKYLENQNPEYLLT